MRRRILILIGLLEIFALLLVVLHMPAGVHTDEAKYLLSIPYPHPPFLRSLMGWTSGLPLHEFFWRFVLATLAVQAVWLVYDLGDVLTRSRRMALCAGWLFSSAVILQAGTVMMVVPTALFGLVFLWHALHPKPPTNAAFLGCLWLVSLFTAYQSVLFAPLVLSALLRTKLFRWHIVLLFAVPLILLALYSLTNPLAIASMVQVTRQDAVVSFVQRAVRIGWIWLLAGGVLSLVGTFGILTANRWDIVAAFGLVFGYVVLTSQQYYAILLTPLFIGGVFLLLCRRKIKPATFIALHLGVSALLVAVAFPPMAPSAARDVMHQLSTQSIDSPVIIDGYFGHEWQYESPVPLYRFSQRLSAATEAKAGAFICTNRGSCDDDVNADLWQPTGIGPVPVWMRH